MAIGDMGPGLSSPFQSPAYNNPTSSGGGTAGEGIATSYGQNAADAVTMSAKVGAICMAVAGLAVGLATPTFGLGMSIAVAAYSAMIGAGVFGGGAMAAVAVAHTFNGQPSIGRVNDLNKDVTINAVGAVQVK